MKNFIQKVMERQGISESDLNCIQAEMLARGLNPQDIADISGVSYSVATRIANGVAAVENMPVTNFIKIAHAFGMTADELYFGERREYEDPTKAGLNAAYDKLDEHGRTLLADVAESMSANQPNRAGGAR